MVAINFPEGVDFGQQVLGTKGVHKSEGAPSEGWEAKSEHSPNVPIHWTIQDSVLETPDSFVHHSSHQPQLYFRNLVATIKNK